ncbi:uncharacterized protein LOC121371457 isoform X2 [Gigantopelta aegis]|nr:uncharacterized protein LOC121371457 isoform X2 [Gigantopelta aegis]
MSKLVITYRKRKKRTVTLPASTPVLNPKACVFCLSEEDNEDDYGKLIMKCEITVHYFCLLFASGLSQGGKESNGVMGFLLSDIKKELKRGSRLRCSYCKEKGSTIGCVVSSCRKTFHLCCGRKLGTLHQFFDSFRSYCPEHRPQQTCKMSDRLAFYGTANTVCSICMYAIEARCSNDTLRAPCCKNAWFHRTCIQKYAVSAGLYFFKCPLCNNKESFQSDMMHYGIYVPDQDASWEKEPGAFDDLARRYTHCDAETCRCPEGRSYDRDASKWEIVVCELCGSVGSHKACHGLKERTSDYVCSACLEVEKRLKEEKKNKLSKIKSKKRSCKSYYKSPKELNKLLKRRAATLSTCGDGESPVSSMGSDTRTHRQTDVVRLVPCDEDLEVDIMGDNSEVCCVQKPRKTKRRYPKLGTSDVKKHTRKKKCKAENSTTSNERLTPANEPTRKLKQVSIKNFTMSTVTGAGLQSLGMHPYRRGVTNDARQQVKEWAICAPPLPVEPVGTDVDSSESDMCSIASVEDDGTHKTVTIKWRGRKIKIFKEIERSKHGSAEMHGCDSTSKLSLVMEVDDSSNTGNVSSTSSAGFISCHQRRSSLADTDDDTPPMLVPVDDNVSMRSTPQGRRLRKEKRVRSVPAKMSSSSSMSDGSDSEGPPILSPIRPYYSRRVEAGRITRSMDKPQNYKTRLCANDFMESLKSPVNASTHGGARRSLEKSFAPDNCQFAFPHVKKWKLRDVDSESVLSCSNSVISVSSNGEEGTVDCDEDCQIFEPSPCIIEKTANGVSLSTRIDIGNTFVHKPVGSRPIHTSVTSQGQEIIDLTES